MKHRIFNLLSVSSSIAIQFVLLITSIDSFLLSNTFQQPLQQLQIPFQNYGEPRQSCHHRHGRRRQQQQQQQHLTNCFASFRPVVNTFKYESLDILLPKQDAIRILQELLSDKNLLEDSIAILSQNWDSLERKLTTEDRSLQVVLGDKSTERLLRSIEGMKNGYDPDAVKTFLGSDAVNLLFAKILYDAIFEFLRRVDILGNIVGTLPILGPIRNQILVELKKTLDRSLGPLVQQFLGTYTKIAVNQGIAFVLSPSNNKEFAKANVKLVKSLLDRPINSFFFSTTSGFSQKAKEEIIGFIRTVEPSDLDIYVDWIYDTLGDKCVMDFVNIDQVLDASPTLQNRLDTLWLKALNAAELQE
jgi:hypothetical protein